METKKKLGEGSYGSVSKGTHKSTNAVRAIKARLSIWDNFEGLGLRI